MSNLPKSDWIYHYPVDLESNENAFGFKPMISYICFYINLYLIYIYIHKSSCPGEGVSPNQKIKNYTLHTLRKSYQNESFPSCCLELWYESKKYNLSKKSRCTRYVKKIYFHFLSVLKKCFQKIIWKQVSVHSEQTNLLVTISYFTKHQKKISPEKK